jgi:TRAP-type C4-dicarboxylate transport system substrate-binding protein
MARDATMPATTAGQDGRNFMRAFIAAAILAVGLAFAAPPAGAQQTLILGGSDAIGSIIDRSNLMFTRLVNERAGNRLRINFIQGEQLGNDVQVIEQMMKGGVHIYGDVLEWYANWVKDLSVLSWGFTFRDFEHQQRFIDSDLFRPYAEELRTRHNIRILGASPSQARVLFARRPIASPDDLKGIKMRVPDIRAYLLLWQTLGTQPTRVAWAEVFLALRTGVVEAAEGPPLSAMAAKMHQAATNVMRTNHVISAYHITVHEPTFAALSPELQKIMTDAAKEAIAWHQQNALAELEAGFEQMRREGATIHTVDTSLFSRAALAGVAEMERDGVWSAGLYEKIQALR